MTKITRIDGRGEVWVKEIVGFEWFECQQPECQEMYHFSILIPETMYEVSRDELITLAHEYAQIDLVDIPFPKTKMGNKQERILQ